MDNFVGTLRRCNGKVPVTTIDIWLGLMGTMSGKQCSVEYKVLHIGGSVRGHFSGWLGLCLPEGGVKINLDFLCMC